MGYMHINNTYKDQKIMLFKECYALEKVDGTSAHIKWKRATETLTLFSGGANHATFVELFDEDALKAKFMEFGAEEMGIYGEAYGGKIQGRKDVYGDKMKFIVFDVMIGEFWQDVPKAETIAIDFGLEFVSYVKIPTTIDALNAARDAEGVQAIRNGMGHGNWREGVVLRPIEEFVKKNGDRVISKHKRDDARETKSKRDISEAEMAVCADARAIAEEWVTDTRLTHVLDKNQFPLDMSVTGKVIAAMEEDVLREGEGEIVVSKQAIKEIGKATALLFKERVKNQLVNVSQIIGETM